MTKADFAKHRNVSRAAVTQWANAGRIVLTSEGRVDVGASEVKLAATLNTRGGPRRKGQQGTVETRGRAESPPAGIELDLAGGTLTDARTSQARNRARLDNLEYMERVGKLVERSRYDAAVAEGLSPILSRLDSLSTRVAPKLIGLTDVRRIQDIVDDEVTAIRQDTSDTLRAMAATAGARPTQQ